MSCISTLTRYWPFSPSKCACGSDNEDIMEDPEGLAVVHLGYCCGVTCGSVGDFSSPECAASPSDSSSICAVSCLDTSRFLGGEFLAVAPLVACCCVPSPKAVIGVSVSSSSASIVNLLWLGALELFVVGSSLRGYCVECFRGFVVLVQLDGGEVNSVERDVCHSLPSLSLKDSVFVSSLLTMIL